MGIFEIGEEHKKIKLENKGQGLQNRDQRGSWYQYDGGYNPRGWSFTIGADPYKEYEEHGEEQREITRGNTQEQVQSHIH